MYHVYLFINNQIKLRIPRSQTSFFLFFEFCFQRKDKPSEKTVIVEEDLDGIDVNDVGNLKCIPRPVSMKSNVVGYIKVVNYGVERTRNINRREKSDVLQAYRGPFLQ